MIAIGVAIDPANLTAGVLAAAVLALILSAELWWIYFANDAEKAEQALASASAVDRIRAAHGGYFYSFVPMLLGVVSIAAGIKKSLGHFTEALETPAASALAIGVALYLFGQAAFRAALRLGTARLRLATAIVAAATVFVGVQVSAAAQMIAPAVLLAALIGAERWAARASLSRPSAASH